MARKIKLLTSRLMIVCMLVGLFPQATLSVAAETNPFTATSTHYNANMGDGILAFKSATPRGDGTVDISIGAYTTGQVVQQSNVKPTDIVLVLDVSGSMDYEASTETITSYEAVNGGRQTEGILWWTTEYYGFGSTSTTYYIQVGDAYLPVSYASRDDNEYQYYTDGTNYYYPILSGNYTNQQHINEDNYHMVQFYSQRTTEVETTRMDALKNASKAFIETTAAKNATIQDPSKQHRIAIIKYATNSFYDSATSTASTSEPSLSEGNDKNSRGYNYTQVVKNFTAVTNETKEALKAKIDSLSPGGGTAIDYGMHLAATLVEETKDDEGRAKTVIAFTDGTPTYNTNFEASVANAALSFAYAFSSTGDVPIYTISMEPNADASVLGTDNSNQFMHYLSSNYPNATSMSAPGEGDISAGYYMTPDNDKGLESIFTGIVQSIGTPQIEMGGGAVVTDTISSYFELADGTQSITIKTLAKTADGWEEEGEEDSGITYTMSDNNQTIKVTGFDFDANYVSDVPRGDNNDFYGKALLIQMNVKPRNNIIDAGASVHGGVVPTNAGLADITDSKGVSVATIERPAITLPKVTYSYTIGGDQNSKTEYASYYRLPGDTGLEVIADPERTEYNFSGWTTTDATVDADTKTYTMPAANVVFTGNFTPKEYNVIYKYDGISLGDQMPALPPTAAHAYASEVTVAAKPEVPGYEFDGWNTDDITVTDNKFTMPASEVTLYGSFTPKTDVAYKVEYYLQQYDDAKGAYGYVLNEDVSYTRYGTTEATVHADQRAFEGYTFNATDSIASGEITGDGKLVLRMYYDINSYPVTYAYVDPNNVPQGAPTVAELDSYAKDVKVGEKVTVEKRPNVTGYDFVGWFRTDMQTLADDGALTEFIMPAHPVELRGYFVAQSSDSNLVPFYVSHWLQSVDNEADYKMVDEPLENRTRTGEVGAEVEGFPRTYPGFEYKPEKSNNGKGIVTQPDPDNGVEPLEIKLYYDRSSYNVSYEIIGDANVVAGIDVPATSSAKYEATVAVAGVPTAPKGYSLSGWSSSDVAITNNQFKMPAGDVKLVAYLELAETTWKEEHYLQKADGSGYDLDIATGNIEHGNITGREVTVNAGHYEGYTFDSVTINGVDATDTMVNDAVTTTVLADGTRVIKFYYNRIPHSVTYKFEGSVPGSVKIEDYEGTEVVPYRTPVSLKGAPTVQGYKFSGWSTQDAVISNGGFTMPNHDVVLTGSFLPQPSEYRVRHLLENLPGDTSGELYGEPGEEKYYTVAATETHNDKNTGALAVAVPRDFTGFAHITSEDKLTGTITGDGGLVIDIHYDRQRFNVHYQYFDDGKLPDNLPTIPEEYGMVGVPFGTELEVKPGMILSGHEFDGWHTLSAAVTRSGNASVYTMPASDVIFFGRFNVDYTVSYVLNGGTGAYGVDYSDKVVVGGTEITVNEAPTRSGHTFTGWNDGTTDYAAGDKMTVNSDVTFTAQWSENSGGGGNLPNPSPTKYTLTYDSNGGSSIAKETYSSGTHVELVKVPAKEGYIFDGWHLDKALTTDVSEVTMTKNITVYAAWIKDNGSAGNGHDVPEGLNGEDHFAYVIGYPDGTVRPNSYITRSEVTTIFFRLLTDETRNANLTDGNAFSDVNDGDWYNTAISTMTKLGIVNGRYADRFVPDAFITRAEFAVICARFDDSEFEVVDEFTDVKGHWAETEIHEAAAHGWIRGYEDNTFKPDQFITRAEAMTMINRVLNRAPETSDDLLDAMIKWPDNSDQTVWYYLPVQEATNSHSYDKKNSIYEAWTSIIEVTDWLKYQ